MLWGAAKAPRIPDLRGGTRTYETPFITLYDKFTTDSTWDVPRATGSEAAEFFIRI